MQSQPSTGTNDGRVLKLLIATLPPTFIIDKFHIESTIAIASCYLAGVVLQALIPPSNKGWLSSAAAILLVIVMYSASTPKLVGKWYFFILLAVAAVLAVKVFEYLLNRYLAAGKL